MSPWFPDKILGKSVEHQQGWSETIPQGNVVLQRAHLLSVIFLAP